MNTKFIYYMVLICIFCLVNTISYGQFTITNRIGSIKAVSIDTSSNPIRMGVTVLVGQGALREITYTPLNDAANTHIIILGIQMCASPHRLRADTTAYIATRFPFNFKIYLRYNDCGGGFFDYDSVFIRPNQILATDDPNQLAAQISIAPNPNNGTFMLQHDATITISAATIYDARGSIYRKITDTDLRQIDLPDVPKGLYIVQMTTNKGQIAKKILIE